MTDRQSSANDTSESQNPLKLAKQIRKEDEPWQEAVKRATEILNEEKDTNDDIQDKTEEKEPSDWRDAIIKTDVDTLLRYVADQGEVSVQDVISHIDVPEETIDVWVDALVKEDIIEKDYTAKGLVLHMNEDNAKAIQQKMSELEGEVRDNIQEAEEKIQSEDTFIQRVKEELRYMGEVLEKDRQREQQLEDALEDVREQERQLHEEEEELEQRIERVLDEMDESLQHVQTAEEWIEEFYTVKTKLQRNIHALKTLQDISEDGAAQETLEHMQDQKQELHRITDRLRKTLRRIVNGNQ